MNKLTESSIKKAEILEKQYKIYDGNGMFLLVHPNGSKYWRMKYTYDGKSKLASFGVWPKVSLKEARERRQEARGKINIGINPVEEKRNKKQIKTFSSGENSINELDNDSESSSLSNRLLRWNSTQGKVRETGELLKLLKSILFDNADDISAAALRQEIEETIDNHEPRVKLKNVKVKPDYEGNAFDVTITYNIVGIDALPQQLNFALQSTR